MHGNVYFLWSFFQFDDFKQGRQQIAARRSAMITCWIYIQPDAEQPTDDSNFIKYFVKSASNLFINDLNPSHELCDNYWISLPGHFILYNINSKKKIKTTHFTITSRSWYIFQFSKCSWRTKIVTCTAAHIPPYSTQIWHENMNPSAHHKLKQLQVDFQKKPNIQRLLWHKHCVLSGCSITKMMP